MILIPLKFADSMENKFTKIIIVSTGKKKTDREEVEVVCHN